MTMASLTLSWNETPPAEYRGGALTIGNFDGVHLGHAALVAEARRQAKAVQGPAVAMTFDPHPLQLLRPEAFQPVLTSTARRAELLHGCGIDHVLILRTTAELLQLRAAEFFQQVIRDRLETRVLVEGPNFGFGRNREGNVQMLGALCRAGGLDLVQVPPLQVAGKPVSSSRVREALVRGAVAEAALWMGRPYRLSGVVGTGQKRGRALGFPTANLENLETLIPGDGVYAVRVHERGQIWPGAANIGPNPTFGEQAHKVEAHLIGFAGDLVGQTLDIEFIERLRDTRPFAGATELVEQLRRDVEQAKKVLAEHTEKAEKKS
jgi:riboflavin kinase/FMN adenylyltransferase